MTFTFDTGMQIALERRKQRATKAFRKIVRRGFPPLVPAVVYVEWWRGTSNVCEEIRLEPRALEQRALEWRRQLETGEVASRAAIARREGLSRARITQILNRLNGAMARRQRAG